VLVADMAVSQPLIDLIGPKAYAKFHTFLKREAAELGVPVLDTAGGVASTTFFFDFDHVNRSGADVFNTVLWRALGKGRPGSFHGVISPDVAAKPLAPTLASDVIAREETRAAAKKPTTPALPSAKPSVDQPSAPAAPVPTPTAPGIDKPAVPAPSVPGP
jgi:hypothetical protein